MVSLNSNDMRKLVTIIALLCCTFCAFAQDAVQEDPKVTQLRKEIGIDYSMPDFKTKKIDGEVIGAHLAGMLNLLQKYINDGTYNWKLAAIVKEQKGMVSQVSIDKMKVTEVFKVGDTITIIMNTKLSKNSEGIRNADIIVVFNNGISDSASVNSLFSYLSRYTFQ